MYRHFDFELEKFCKLVKDEKKKRELTGKLADLKLNKLEEFLATRLYVPTVDNLDDAFDEYKRIVGYFRVNPGDSAWLYSSDVENIKISGEMLLDEKFNGQILNALYLWYSGDYAQPAIALLRKFEELTDGDLLFAKFQPISDLYVRICVLIIVNYFYSLPQEWQTLLFNSPVLLSTATGLLLDVDRAIDFAFDEYSNLDNRIEIGRNFASFLYENTLEIGKKTDKSDGDIKYWLDKFGEFTGKQYDLKKLGDFENQADIWANCLAEEKIAIIEIINIFSKLITQKYAVPKADEKKLAEITKKTMKSFAVSARSLIDIKQEAQQKFKTDKNGKIIEIEGVLAFLKMIAEKERNPKIEEMFYYNEKSGEFEWNV